MILTIFMFITFSIIFSLKKDKLSSMLAFSNRSFIFFALKKSIF